MKKKTLLAILLCAAMALSFTACSGKPTQSSAPANAQANGVSLKLLYQTGNDAVANVVRDELTKSGFAVNLSAAADTAAFNEALKGGNFDVVIGSWANPVGTPDYGCRGVWISNGDNNLTGIKDADLDALIVKAAGQTKKDYVATYAAAEKLVTEEKVYNTPLYLNVNARAFSKLLSSDSIKNNMRWEQLDYADTAMRNSRPVVLTQTGASIFTWDPIRADDPSSGYALDEMYIHLLTITPDYGVTTDASLSYNYAISQDNKSFYFILRDDCGFARVDANGKVFDSGVKVAAEDVVYSLDRARTKDSIPLHKVYSMYSTISKVSIVSDKNELSTIKTAEGKSVLDTLQSGITPISTLSKDRTDVSNANGKYQVVRVDTSVPFPQILNSLCFHGAGIVDSEWVKAANKNVNVSAYDASKDKLYGDSKTTVLGSGFNNQLSLSGNYVLTSMNEYQMNFVANPAIRTKDPNVTKIKALTDKFITDPEAALSALRSGEVDFAYTIPTAKYDIVKQDSKLALGVFPGFRVYYLGYNMYGKSVVSNSVDLRKAIASSIKYEDISAVLNGNAIKPYSILSSAMDTGNKLSYQAGDTAKYLKAYQDSKK